MESKVTELGIEKATTEDKEKQYQTQITALEEHKNSLTALLKSAMEQKADIRPLKEHVLMLRKRIHKKQLHIEDERCKVLQVDTMLEEIISTTSYFLDRTQDILEILKGRMVWVETNKESPAELSFKDQQTLKQEYELIEFASNTAEEFKKTVKNTKIACAEFCRRVLLTYS